MKKIAVAQLERDLALQPRSTLHQDWIEEYALDMASGAQFPPVTVFFDGDKYWLADGFHRAMGAESLGLLDIEADIRRGNRRDALLFSVGANAIHGHRRTNDDKRRAVDIMLADPEWAMLPDREIARLCAVTHPFVAAQRPKKPSGNDYQIDPRIRKVMRDGKAYDMQTGNIGSGRVDSPRSEQSPSPASVPTAQPPTELFDWHAEKVRSRAIEAILELADQPPAEDVIAAWMKSDGYGEPQAKMDAALKWLGEFVALYREAEPRRWADVQRRAALHRGEVADAA